MKLRFRTPIAPLLAAALLAFAALPAGAGLFDDDVARKQIADLQKRVDAQNGEMSSRLARLEEMLKAPNQPVLELANQLQAMREELRSLRGQIEVLSNTVEGNAKRQRDMYVDLDSRLRRFEGASAPAAGSGPGAAAPAAPAAAAAAASAAPAPAAAAPGNEKGAYEAAQSLRRNGNYQAAIVAFQNFIVQFPRSSLANRAQYWIGDSYYNLRDYRSAIASQQTLLSTYSDSPSVPDALLNMATSQMELGETTAAKRTMGSLVARYPTSDAAEKAKRRLATLR